MEVEEQIRAIVTPLVEDLSVDLWDVEWSGSRLRILVDKPKGIDTETLGLVSRILSSELDEADPLPSQYIFEVSSPGLERTLRHLEHFEISIGKQVSIKSNVPIEDETRFMGILTEVSEDKILLQTDQATREIPFSSIKKANIVFNWDELSSDKNMDTELVKDL